MARISDEDIQRVRDATDLVSLVAERVVLKQKGRLFWGNCPFHGEKTPSFKIDPATQLWHCFGCGKGGDAYKYVMLAENVDFVESVRGLADRAHIEIVAEAGGVPRGRKERLTAASEAAAAFYHDTLTKSPMPAAKKAREYLGGRGFGSDVSRTWTLGFAAGGTVLVKHLASAGFSADEMVDANLALKSDRGQLKDRFYERIMFPIRDLQGRTIAFGGRVIEHKEPKYLNTTDTPIFHKSANMYGIERAKATITSSGTAIVVEGYTDVIALHEAGITNVVATLGTALTKEHVRLLSRFAKRVVFLFDGDAAGMRAADRASGFADRTITPEAGSDRISLEVTVLPGGDDPADYVAANGAEALNAAVANAVPLLRFSIDRRLDAFDLDKPEERARALKAAVEVLAPVKESLLADDYANYIADRLFADFATVRRAVSATKVDTRQETAVEGVRGGGAADPKVEVAPVMAVDSRQMRIERELLDLLVRTPRLRAGARFLLDEGLLTEGLNREIASVVADTPETVAPAALVGELETRVPGSAAALSGATIGTMTEDEIDLAVRQLTRGLKEFVLERRIRQDGSWLKQHESLKQSAEYDEVFRKVSSLRMELAELKSGVRDVGFVPGGGRA